MTIKQLLCASALTLTLCGPAFTQEARGPYVRLAELEIDLRNWKTLKLRSRKESKQPFA